ncbi:hypothetical protein GCM10009844_05400 [Nocardioides koreensis]|uniref:SMP-30/Gluconolactonase/LRE-like region domain-containing protein n=1 Tax=Nocardioides koreensis TaxID=433651 RepID=A0ABN2Z7C2_9ACTN
MELLQPVWETVPIEAGELFEGARWIPDTDQFQWVDILRGLVCRWSPYGGAGVEVRDLGLEFVTVALPLDARSQVVASRDTVHVYDWETRELTPIARADFDEDVRFNDGGLAPDGRAYIGTMSMAGRDYAGSLYEVAAGELVEILTGVGISNGIGWRDQGSAYYVDSFHPRIDILDLGRRPARRRGFASLDTGDEPDGLTVGPNGEVYVALWRGERAARFARSGERLPDISIPANYPTSIAFGGRDGDLLLVTSAGHNEVSVPPKSADGEIFVTSASALLNYKG